ALGEPPGPALELELGELLRVDGDAALRATERDVHERGLPRHDRSKAEHLVVIGVGVIADPPLAGAARAVVLDAVAGEHFDAAVVHPHRDLDLHFAKRRPENAAHVASGADGIGGAIELARDDGLPRHRSAW